MKRIALAASGMMDVFKKMWPDAWGVRMGHILRNVLMALLEQPNATLHDVLRMFSDNAFRKDIAKSLRNETVRTFLLKEFERFSFGYRADGTAPIQNKVGAFLADPLLNRILTAPEKDLHIRQIMDRGQDPEVRKLQQVELLELGLEFAREVRGVLDAHAEGDDGACISQDGMATSGSS